MRIYTIGHSTRTTEEFVVLLHEAGVTRLADVRRHPGSRRLPHFSNEALERDLQVSGIGYVHLEELGGRRKPQPDSPNGFWRNDQFRAYADHMATPEFLGGVDRLLGADAVTAVMCAEAVPWRCHRNLLSDELIRREVEVVHLLARGKSQVHSLSAAARLLEDHVIYPPEQATILFIVKY